MPSDVLITPASSKVEFTDGSNATKTLRITGTSFSFDSDLGIGITSPTSKLNVLSTTSLSSVFKAEGVNGTLFEVTDDLSNSLMSVNTIGGLPVFEVFANNTIIAGQYGANDFVINGNKVGIGNSSPNNKLHVAGSASIGLNYNVAAPTNGLIVEGNVGIGLTNPSTYSSQLTIETTQSRAIMAFNTALADAGTIYGLGFGYAMSNYNSAYISFYKVGNSNTLNRLSFSLWNQNDILNILGNGNVGVGITNPTSKFYVSAGTLAINQRAMFINADITTNTSVYTHTLNLIDSSASDNPTSLALGTYSHVVFRNRAVTAGSIGGVLDIYTRDAGLGGNPTVKMTVTDVGNVGIGNTAPLNKLHVAGSASVGSNYNVAGPTNGLIVEGSVGIGTTSPTEKLHIYNTSAVNAILESGTTGTSGKLIFKTSDNADLNKYITQDSYYMVFNSHANEGFKFRDSSSNILMSIFGASNAFASRVGIGTITPSEKLAVEGNISLAASDETSFGSGRKIRFYRYSDGWEPAQIEQIWTGSSFQGILAFKTNTGAINTLTTKMVIDNIGNVGIGVTTPVWKLDVSGSGVRSFATGAVEPGFIVDYDSTNGYGGFFIHTNGTRKWRIGNVGDTSLNPALFIWQEGVGARMYFQNNGQVGVGTTSPAGKFDVYENSNAAHISIVRNVNAGSSAYSAFFLGNNEGNNKLVMFTNSSTRTGDGGVGNSTIRTDSGKLYLGAGATQHILDTTGNVGIGNTSPNNKLAVSGSVSVGSGYNTAAPTNGLIVEGSVGIGVSTLNAGAKLHVVGNADIGDSTDDTGIIVRHGAGSAQYGRIRFYSTSTNIHTIHSFPTAWQNGTFLSSSTGALNLNGTNGITFGSWNNVDVAFASNGTNYFKKSVGIGITSPSAILHANSTTSGATLIRADGTNGTLFSVVDDLSDSLMSVNNSAGLPVLEVFADDRVVMGQYGQNDFVLVNNKLGLGTNNPAYKLDINGTLNVSGTASLSTVSITGTINSSATEAIRINNNNGFISFYNSAASTRTGYLQGNTGNSVLLASENNAIIQFSVGGTIRATISTSGDVGIGTVTPTSQSNYRFLQVNGTNSAVIETMVGGARIGGFDSDSSNLYVGTIGAFPIVFRTGVNEKWRITNAGIFQSSGAQTIQTSTGNLTIATAAGNGHIILSNHGTGNVGIGTNTPVALLDLYSSASRIKFHRGASYDMSFGMHDATYSALSIKNASDASTLIYFQYDGSIGIGTTIPTSKLDVTGGNIELDPNQFITFNNAGTVPKIGYRTSGPQAGLDLYDNAGLLTISIGNQAVGIGDYAGGNALPVKGLAVSGNVGIGTATPAFKLDVNSSIVSRSTLNSPRFSSAGTYVYGVTNSPTWNQSCGTAVNNNATAPDGTTTAGTYTLNSSCGSYDVFQTITGLTVGRVYTVGMWVKLGTATNFCLVVNNTAAWNTIGGKAFTSSDGLSTGKWTHISYTFSQPGGSNQINLHLGYHAETGVAQQTAGTVFIWNIEMTEFSSTWIGNVEDEIRLPGSSIWTSRGNVGIGTVTPTGTYGKLAVAGGIRTLDDNNSKLELGRYSSGASNSYIKLGSNSNSLRITNNTDAADIFTIENNGNVGIGTTSPTGGGLHVYGASGATGTIRLQSSDGRRYDIGSTGTAYGSANNFIIYDITASAERFRLQPDGNIGIGSANPTQRLTINTGAATNSGAIYPIRLSGGTMTSINDATGIQFIQRDANNDYGGYIRILNTQGNPNYLNPRLEFGVQDTDTNLFSSVTTKMVVTGGGNVGIGTVNPGTSLEIYATPATSTTLRQMLIINTDFGSASGTGFGGSIVFKGRTAGNVLQDNAQISAYNEDTGDNGYALGFYTRPTVAGGLTQRLTILRGGNVGIGTISPSAKLQVIGGVQFGYGSDSVFYTGTEFDSSKYLILQNNTDSYGRIGLAINAKTFNGANTPSTNDGWAMDPRSGIRFRGWLSGDSGYDTKFVIQHLLANATNAVGDFGIFAKGFSTTIPAFVLAGGGNVGVGTTTPSNKLHIYSSANEPVLIQGTTGGAWLNFQSSTSNLWSIGAINVTGFGIYNRTTNTNTLFVANNGNIGVGNIYTSNNKLHVDGSMSVGSGYNTAAPTNGLIVQGSVGIGASSPNNKLTVQADASTNVSFADNSVGQLVIRGDTDTTKRLALGIDTTNNIGVIQAQKYGTGVYNLAIQPTGGNVGVGTASPSSNVHIVAASAITNTSLLRLDSGTTGFNGANDANTAYALTFDACSYKLSTSVVQRTGAEIQMLKSGSWNEAAGGTGTRASLVFKTNNGTIDSPSLSERMRIQYDGNVGIGITAPTSKLNVLSSVSLSSVFKAEGINGTLFEVTDDLSNSLMSVNTIGGLPVFEVFANNTIIAGQYGANDFVINGNKVGIGTANPSFKLDVNGTLGVNAGTSDGNWPFIVVDTNTAGGTNRYALNKTGAMGFNHADSYAQLQLVGANGAYIDFANSSVDDGDARIIYYSNTRFDFVYGTTMTINSTGVGIATTTPYTRAHVYGTLTVDAAGAAINNFTEGIRLGAATNGYSIVTFGANAAASNGQITNQWWIGKHGSDNSFNFNSQGGGDVFRILQNGNVGIGNTTPSYKLHVNGNGYFNGILNVNSNLNLFGGGDLIINDSDGTGFFASYMDAGVAYMRVDDGGTANGSLYINSKFFVGPSTGNVGVGTVTPASLFHVSKAGNSAGGTILMGLANDGAAKWSYLVSTQYNSSTYPQGFSLIGGSTNSTQNVVAIGGSIYEANPATEIQFYTHTAVSHNTGGSLRMVVNTNGNVGIGAASPADKLDVNGNLYFSKSSDPLIYAGSGIGLNIDGQALYLNRYTNANIAMVIGGGNVGVGITTPLNKLHVVQSTPTGTTSTPTNTTLRLDSNSNNYLSFVNTVDNQTYAGLTFTDNNLGGYIVFRNYTGNVLNGSDSMIYGAYQDHVFQSTVSAVNTGTEVMRIKGNGNIGIGTTTPSSKLHILQASSEGVYVDGASNYATIKLLYGGTQKSEFVWYNPSNALYLQNFSAAGTFGYYRNGTIDFWINSSGNVAIGNITSPANKLHVNGSVSIGSGYNTAAPTDGLIVQGNVAIGATTASDKLTVVNGNISLSDSYKLYNGSASDSVGLFFSAALQANISGYNGIIFRSSTTNIAGQTERMRIANNGNIGIGITAPSAALHLNSTTSGATLLRADGTNGTLFSVVDDLSDSLMSVNNSAGLPILEVFADDRVVAGQYGANDFVLVNNKLGLGTNNPNAKLESYQSSNAITFNYLATNLNNSSPIPVYSFDVTNGVGESRSIKAGIGYERHLTNGRGTMHFYNRSTNDTANFSGTRSSSGDIRMSIDNAGYVGIGTPTPSWLLTVYATSAPQFTLQNNTRSFVLTNNSGDNLLSFNYDGANRLQFDTTNQWFNTGNVGIGITSPAAKLDVSGVIRGDAGANNPHSFTNTDAGNTHWTNRGDRLLTSNGAGWQTDGRDPIMALVTSGNSNSLNIANSIGLALHNESQTNNTFSPAITFSNRSNSGNYNTTYAAIIGKKTGQGVDSNWSAGELHFYTMPVGAYVSNIPSLMIDSAGKVGIGTTAPATTLQIGTGTPQAATGGIQFGDDTAARIYRVSSSTIQVSNNLTVGGTLTESSSIRYKENIQTISAPILPKLEAIRPVTYNKKDDINNIEYGIIAEELNELFPELVNKNGNGEVESVNYSRLTVLLIKAVKELKQEIEILKNK